MHGRARSFGRFILILIIICTHRSKIGNKASRCFGSPGTGRLGAGRLDGHLTLGALDTIHHNFVVAVFLHLTKSSLHSRLENRFLGFDLAITVLPRRYQRGLKPTEIQKKMAWLTCDPITMGTDGKSQKKEKAHVAHSHFHLHDR